MTQIEMMKLNETKNENLKVNFELLLAKECETLKASSRLFLHYYDFFIASFA
jgi:hypothetical protein